MSEEKGFFGRLVEGLNKTRDNIVSGMDSVFGGFSSIDDDFYEELEEVMIMGDLGVTATYDILDDLKEKVKERHIKNPADCRELLIESIRDQMSVGAVEYEFEEMNPVIMVVGVNGVGKTTTIGKLAGQYHAQGKRVIVAAADTFRAAAGEQLKEWADRAHAELIGGQEGSDPAAVVYDAVAAAKARHADILLCQLGLWEKAQIFHGDPEKLTRNYPGNIRYNAVCTGKYFIHNLQYTDPDLLAAAEAKAAADSTILTKIHVKQGYTRCSLLPVDDRSFITSDAGIAKTLAGHDTDVLLIHPGHVHLPGFDYGFIGGTGGGLPLSGRRLLVVNGNIEAHPDYKKIATFLEDRDIDLYYSKDRPLMDIGSILVDAALKPLQQPVRD